MNDVVDRLGYFTLALSALAAFIYLMVLFFRDPSLSPGAPSETEAQSPFRLMLEFWASETRARHAFELESARIELEKIRLEKRS